MPDSFTQVTRLIADRFRESIYRFPPKFRIALFLTILHFHSSSQPLNRILFIFDDSYSMYGPWNSNVKIEVAKTVMSEFLDSLKRIPALELALRCYGHTTFFRE